MAVGKRGWFILVMKRGKQFLSNSIDVQYFGDMPITFSRRIKINCDTIFNYEFPMENLSPLAKIY